MLKEENKGHGSRRNHRGCVIPSSWTPGAPASGRLAPASHSLRTRTSVSCAHGLLPQEGHGSQYDSLTQLRCSFPAPKALSHRVCVNHSPRTSSAPASGALRVCLPLSKRTDLRLMCLVSPSPKDSLPSHMQLTTTTQVLVSSKNALEQAAPP